VGPHLNGHDAAHVVHPADLVMEHDGGSADAAAERWPSIDEPWPDAAADEFEEQRARLQVDIAAQQQRLAAARHAAAARDAEMRTALRNALVEVRAQLTEMERAHDERLVALREATAAQVRQILEGSVEADDVN
jgi:hypothetical protein